MDEFQTAWSRLAPDLKAKFVAEETFTERQWWRVVGEVDMREVVGRMLVRDGSGYVPTSDFVAFARAQGD